jgi:hypothetical protein
MDTRNLASPDSAIEIKRDDNKGAKNLLTCSLGCLSSIDKVAQLSSRKKDISYKTIPMRIYEYKKKGYKKEFTCSLCNKKVIIEVGSEKSGSGGYKKTIFIFIIIFILNIFVSNNTPDSPTFMSAMVQSFIILFVIMMAIIIIEMIDNFGVHKSFKVFKIKLKTEGKNDSNKYHVLINFRRNKLFKNY